MSHEQPRREEGINERDGGETDVSGRHVISESIGGQ
ncbi:hypothetical protein L195_g042802, partial [Trifolium pratense]